MTGYCPTCEREWAALGEAHCAGCCSHFTSDSAFSKHQVRGECLDPSTIDALEVTQRASGPAYKWKGEADHIWAASARGEESQRARGAA